jgi:class 3 adenylate cyclase
MIPLEAGRAIVDMMPNASMVELEGEDHIIQTGTREELVEPLRTFLDLEMPPIDEGRRLATVLFTDLVGSTARSVELGDTAWGELLERHHDLVRRELARHGGAEVDTAGDGCFATFDGPAAAARCAMTIVGAVERLDLRIRAGVHTGEVETIDGKIGGIAVTIGARIGALAEASEVLVSSTVKDLVAGSGLLFEDAGEHELKGVPEPWRLHRVVAE